MPHPVTTTFQQMPRISLTWQSVVLTVITGFAATAIATESTNAEPPQVTGPTTVVRITDAATFNAVTSGSWALSGTLQVVFDGRIMPHEANAFELFSAGVKAVQGRFERLELPTGWQGDLQYRKTAPFVVLKNLRPDRSPAFPGAEGFGKFTIGGRGGRVIEVVNLNDSGDGSFRAACEAEGPRTVIFRISGTITLEKSLSIKNPYLTIAGQTAPRRRNLHPWSAGQAGY